MTEWYLNSAFHLKDKSTLIGSALACLLFVNSTWAQDANKPAKPAAPPTMTPLPLPSTQTSPSPTPTAASAQPKTKSKAMDRLDLESTSITGNRELPKVLYIVPWKKADLGDLGGRPANSLLDEVLAPVDRDVFRRQTEYYTRLNESTSPAGTAATDK